MQRIHLSYLFCALFLLPQFVFAQPAMDAHSPSSCLVEKTDLLWVEGAEFIMGNDSTYKEKGIDKLTSN